MKKESEDGVIYGKKCPKGQHKFGPTADARYDKCFHCPAMKVRSKPRGIVEENI